MTDAEIRFQLLALAQLQADALARLAQTAERVPDPNNVLRTGIASDQNHLKQLIDSLNTK
jgi:hypothetical protein